MRRIAIALTVMGTMLLAAGSAHAALLAESGGIIFYVADPGEKNDVQVGTDRLLGEPVYTFKDADANPIRTQGERCELVNGIGMCRQELANSMVINVRDRDDTAQVGDAIGIGAVMIGGRGIDVLTGG